MEAFSIVVEKPKLAHVIAQDMCLSAKSLPVTEITTTCFSYMIQAKEK